MIFERSLKAAAVAVSCNEHVFSPKSWKEMCRYVLSKNVKNRLTPMYFNSVKMTLPWRRLR